MESSGIISFPAALEKMVSHLLVHEEMPFLDLVQYSWRCGWEIADVGDPEDDDELRYALKACILERMAEIWSAPPKNCPSRAPDWCRNVPPVAVRFAVHSPEYASYWENETFSPVFMKRNIFAPREFMFFV